MGNTCIATCGVVVVGSMPMEPHLLTVDSRGRVPITKVGRKGDRHYLATSTADGVITLTPAVVMPAREAELLAGTTKVEAVKEGDDR